MSDAMNKPLCFPGLTLGGLPLHAAAPPENPLATAVSVSSFQPTDKEIQ
jgi:hypothetical protein